MVPLVPWYVTVRSLYSMSLDLSSPHARSDWGDVPNAARQDRAILTAKNNVQAAEEDGHVVARDADVGSEKA